MRILWRGVWTTLGLLLAAGLLFSGLRIAHPPQMVDLDHLAKKARYLQRISNNVSEASRRPNIVLVLFDDLGYGDLGNYGSRAIRTPHLDRVAASGIRFTQAYAPSPYCSASRAGLLTGRHPTRMGFDHVLQPAGTWKDLLLRIGGRNRQLPAEEITLPEILAAAGYRTKLVGKWHLGDRSPSLPLDRGFESYFGLLFSNDQGEPDLWRDRKVAEPHPIDQSRLTERYTLEAIDFLSQQGNQPFFLFLAHTFPHIPLSASAPFSGRSEGGLYGDVVEELDASVGRLLDSLERQGLSDNTAVLITSDNGPWFEGSSGGFRGRKMDVFEGGMRVPFLARWPGTIPAGLKVDALMSGLDVMPTVLALSGLPLPDDRVIDGVDLSPVLRRGAGAPRDTILYTQISQFHAWRRGRFKYHARHRMLYGNPMDWRWAPFVSKGPWLFDLGRDPEESYNLSHHRPEVTARLAAELEQVERQWRENRRGWITDRQPTEAR